MFCLIQGFKKTCYVSRGIGKVLLKTAIFYGKNEAYKIKAKHIKTLKNEKIREHNCITGDL